MLSNAIKSFSNFEIYVTLKRTLPRQFCCAYFWREQMSEYLPLYKEYIKILRKALNGERFVL